MIMLTRVCHAKRFSPDRMLGSNQKKRLSHGGAVTGMVPASTANCLEPRDSNVGAGEH